MNTSDSWTIEENSPNRLSYLCDLSKQDSPRVSLRIIYNKEEDSVKVFYQEPLHHETINISDPVLIFIVF